MVMCYLGKLRYVCNIILRVPDTLNIHRLGLFIDSSGDILRAVTLNEFYRNSVLLEQYLELIIGLYNKH